MASKAGKKNGVVIQGLSSFVNGVDRDTVYFYSGVERDYITYRIKTDQQTAGVTTCQCAVAQSSGTVYWGDGTFDNYTSSLNLTHDYGVAGTYDIYLYTSAFTFSTPGNNERPKYLLIKDFRKQKFNVYSEYVNMPNLDTDANAGGPEITAALNRPSRAFTNCDSLTTVNASQWAPFPTSISFSGQIFNGCDSFNDAGVADWNVEQFPQFNDIFANCTSFNVDLSAWATKFVKNTNLTISSLFSNCTSFTNGGVGGVGAGLDSWQLNNVTTMNNLFSGTCGFNDRLDSWDTSRVTSMAGMFSLNKAFTNAGQNGVGLGIDNWTTTSLTNLQETFSRYSGSTGFYIGSWNTSGVTNFYRTFGTNTFIFSDFPTWNDGSINNWDVSAATTMEQMFRHCSNFNQPLNNWTMPLCTSMRQMFSSTYNGVHQFNQDISSWNTSSVTTFQNMFQGSAFNNGGVSLSGGNFNTSAATDLSGMFGGATVFNQDISTWNTSNLINASGMFGGASAFNQPIDYDSVNNYWDMSTVQNCSSMFSNATSFNQPLNNWQMTAVTTVEDMFNGATSFNQNIPNWDMGNCTNFVEMFRSSGFNGTVTNWNTSSAQSFSFTFSNSPFDQDVSNWSIASLTNASGMFTFNYAWSTTNYDLLLDSTTGWASQATIQTGVTLNAPHTQYTLGGNAEAGRNILTGTYGWTIQDAGGI